MDIPKTTIIHWFRKGLRVHDNPALLEAVQIAISKKSFLRPIFIIDPNIPAWMKVGPNRWRFLVQSLIDLNEILKKINCRLYVLRGKPEDVFKRIFSEWNVSLLTFESDIEPFARERDKKIELLGKEYKITIIQKISHTVYNPEIVLAKNFGKPPLTYQKFLSVTETFKKNITLASYPSIVSDYCKPACDSLEKINSQCYDPPTLKELKVNEEELGINLYPGGESEALLRMEKFLKQKQWICKFEKPNTSPNSLEPSTTVLSPYLKFGCLSSRLFFNRLNEVIKGTLHSKPPVSLMGQLMWREFYYTAAAGTPNFDKMVGNPICIQVDWDKNDEYLQAWKTGQTGYPFIDAIMRQLKSEGWIHHLARHAVACFLTRGDLWISWEEGLKVFEEYLLDADWSLNAGNWMWLSASAFFHQFFRVYSPVAFGKKTDKKGEYIKKYVPELKKFPEAYIYEPWLAPKDIQKHAGCIVGKDYPERIVIHEQISKINISRMSAAYKRNKSNIESKPSLKTNSEQQKGTKRKR